MSEASPGADTLQIGLLMEAAHAHQTMAAAHLDKLRTHTDDLDGIVRDTIARTLVDELRSVTGECERAAGALRELQHLARRRAVLWQACSVMLCTAIPTVIMQLALPSSAAVAELKSHRDALARTVAQLEQRGGKIELRDCGPARRLCVRVDRQAPVFGEHADYYVVGGY